jgi:ferredoxin
VTIIQIRFFHNLASLCLVEETQNLCVRDFSCTAASRSLVQMIDSLLKLVQSLPQTLLHIVMSPWRWFVRTKLRPATPNPGTQVHTVKFRGEEIKVQNGELLRTALIRRGLTPHNGPAKVYNCRGMSACGTCAVEVKGNIVPEKCNIHEKLQLSLPPFTTACKRKDLRLACQCEVNGEY